MDEPKVIFSIQEDPKIVRRLDVIAEAEGVSRAAIVRRAIRRYLKEVQHLFLPTEPTSESDAKLTGEGDAE